MKVRALSAIAACIFFSIAVPAAQAHEVYVLSPLSVEEALHADPFPILDTITGNIGEFMFWGCIAVTTVVLVLLLSVSRVLEALIDPFLERLRRYAPVVSRITIGLSFIAAAYFGAIFGPELPLHELFPGFEFLASIVLCAAGLSIVAGFYTRYAAAVALLVFGLYVYHHGWYMLTYTNYVGEIIVLLILGAHRIGVHAHADRRGRGLRGVFGTLADRIAPFSFTILRVTFGISLIYSSLYAKFLHNMLALEIASTPFADHVHTLAEDLGGFEPHFLVLGAGIIEILIGLFFIIGFEIRFTALFLEFWLALSLFYFGEVVWPHVILIGIPLAFIFYGYDKYSIEGYFFKNAKRKPIL